MAQPISETNKKKYTEEDLEKMFEHRFTDRDEEYVKTVDKNDDKPPCVTQWTTKPKRCFDYIRKGGKDGNRVFYGGKRDREYRDRDSRSNRRDGYRDNRDDSSTQRDRSRDAHRRHRTSQYQRRDN